MQAPPKTKQAKQANIEALEKQAYARKYFTIRLLDGETMDVRLLEVSQYHLLVEAEKGKLLVPKHSIKYVVLESYDEPEDGAALAGTGLAQARGN